MQHIPHGLLIINCALQLPTSLSRAQRAASGIRPRPDLLDEKAVIAQLEEENNEMLREIAVMEQQQALVDAAPHLAGLRDRTAELEARMREKQQVRRQLMQQLERLMTQLNVSG